MGEGQSKQLRATQNRSMPTKTSVATGDIKSEDLTSLQSRCIPKGLRGGDGSIQLQASAPVAAPAAAPAAAMNPGIQPPAHNSAQPVMPNGMQPAPFIAAPTNLPRSSSMVVAAPQPQPVLVPQPVSNLPRSSSMVRASAPYPQPVSNLPRSSSMVLASAPQGVPMLVQGAFPRSDSMVRTQQQVAPTPVPVPVPIQMPRSSSMVRTSAQQQVLLTQPAPVPATNAPGALPRSSSMVRTQPPEMSNGPRSVQVSSGLALPTTSAPSLVPASMQPDALLGSRTMIPTPLTTQAPSLVPKAMQPAPSSLMPTTSAPSLIPAAMQQQLAPVSEVAQQVPLNLRVPQPAPPSAQAPVQPPAAFGHRQWASSPEPLRATSIQIGMPPSSLRGSRSPGPSTRGNPPPQMRARDVYNRMNGTNIQG